MISIISAKSVSQNIIGYKNTLPWKQSEDLKRFKILTVGRTVVMGRKTFESIGSKPLPSRHNIVVSSSKPEDNLTGATWLTIDEVNMLVQTLPNVFIIGGQSLYQHFLPIADMLYLTDISTDASVTGDAFFPEIDYGEWNLDKSENYLADDKNQFPYRFLEYSRKL